VPSLREGDRRQAGRLRAQWKNKPDLDSEEREMEKNVMLTPLVLAANEPTERKVA
jgi:hypothetical protein